MESPSERSREKLIMFSLENPDAYCLVPEHTKINNPARIANEQDDAGLVRRVTNHSPFILST